MPLDEIEKAARETKPDSHVQICIADLRELAESNPEHPCSVDFLKSGSVQRRPDDHMVAVDREDILAIIENREVQIRRVIEEGNDGNKVSVIRKTLGKPVEKKEPAPEDK